MDAIVRSSYLPAERLAGFAPAFRRKGRVQEGADADLLIFQLEKLQDHATYTDPYQASTGWSPRDRRWRAGDHLRRRHGCTPGSPHHQSLRVGCLD